MKTNTVVIVGVSFLAGALAMHWLSTRSDGAPTATAPVTINHSAYQAKPKQPQSITRQPEISEPVLPLQTTTAKAPTSEQITQYQTILAGLHDPENHTLSELLQSAHSLTPEQQEQLQREYTALGLQITDFKMPQPPRHQTVAEGAPRPTAEEQARFENIHAQLYDQSHMENLTVYDLALQLNDQKIPPALKQELADKVLEMARNGEIKSKTFLDSLGGPNGSTNLYFN